MKSQDLIIVLLAVIVLLLFMRKLSTYAASASPENLQPTIIVPASGDWMDIDPSSLSSLVIAAGSSSGVDLSTVKLSNLNWMMWAGSNVLANGTTISLPSGVTVANAFGLRRQITTDSSGAPTGGTLQFLIGDPSSKLTKPCGLGANWDSDDGRVGLPDYVLFKKSKEDPRAPVNCSYTLADAGCTATQCGTTGTKKYTVTGFAAAQYGGMCPQEKGATITGNGVITSNEPCSAPLCPPPPPAPSPQPSAPTPRGPQPSAPTPSGPQPSPLGPQPSAPTPSGPQPSAPTPSGPQPSPRGPQPSPLGPPPPPTNCSYTTADAGCTATLCGTTGTKKYTVTGFSAAQNGGACALFKGAAISGNGVITSTETCSAPACQLVSASGLQKFFGLSSPAPAPAPAPVTTAKPPPPATALSNYIFYNNKNSGGNDITNKPDDKPDAEACAAECNVRPGCKAFVFMPGNKQNNCFYKSVADKSPNPNPDTDYYVAKS